MILGSRTIIALCLLAVILLFLRKLRIDASKRSDEAFAAQHGCQRIQARTRSKWPLAIDLISGMFTANKEGHLLAWQQRFVDELGNNLEQHALGNYGIITLDPVNIKAVQSRSEFRPGELDYVFGKRRDAFLPFLGEGLFTQDGAAWKRSRELLRRQFAKIQYSNLNFYTEHVERLVNKLASSKEGAVDLQPLFFDFTLDTTTALLFGASDGDLQHAGRDQFSESFDEASWICSIRVKLIDFYWAYNPQRFGKACARVREYAEYYVNKELARKQGQDDKSSFVHSLYNEFQSTALVRDQLINVLLGGRDTTACLLSWTIRLLIRHDSVLTKLRAEIRSVLGVETAVTKRHIQDMSYLRDILTETLRLYPSVPLNVRTAKETTLLPRGGGQDGTAPVLVPKNMGVGFTVYHMHRRRDLYGEDADQFRPERWSDGTLAQDVGWGYLPFNNGPRACLGQEFALLEASYAVIRIVQEFPGLSLHPDEPDEPIGTERQLLTLTLSPMDGCRVRLRQ